MHTDSQLSYAALNLALMGGYYYFNRSSLCSNKQIFTGVSGVALSYLAIESRPLMSNKKQEVPDWVYITSGAACIGIAGNLAELSFKINTISTFVLTGMQSAIHYVKTRDGLISERDPNRPQDTPNSLDRSQYEKTWATRGDGACALHALNGEVVNGMWVFNPENMQNVDCGRSAKNHFLKLLSSQLSSISDGSIFGMLHCYESIILYMDCLQEFKSRDHQNAGEKKLFQSKLAEFLVHRESKLEKAKEDRRNLYVKMVEEGESLEILTLLQDTKEEYRHWDLPQFQAFLISNPKACENAFNEQFYTILPVLNQNSHFKDVMGELFSAYEGVAQKEILFFSSDHVFSTYSKQLLKQGYHLSDNELKLAAHLYGKKVILFSRHQAPTVLNDQGKECVAIEHSGSHQSGHYSRLSFRR